MGHAADSREGACPGKGTPHTQRPPGSEVLGARPRDPISQQTGPFRLARDSIPRASCPPTQWFLLGMEERGPETDSVRPDSGTSPNATPSSQDQRGGYEHRRGDFPSLSLSPGRPGLSPRGRGDPTPCSALNFHALHIQAPLQDWGEETEACAVYSVSLRRQRSQRQSPREGPGDSQVRRGLKGAAGRSAGEGGVERRGQEVSRRGRSRGLELGLEGKAELRGSQVRWESR